MFYCGLFSLCFSLSCYVSAVYGLRFGSFKGVPYLFNYTDGQDWCDPSFECEIINYLCWRLGDGGHCQLTVFDTLEQRLTALANNEVDIVISRFSVTPERVEVVDFVRPYYYSSGALLYSLPKDQDVLLSYEDLLSQSVCMDTGYYAAQTLIDDYGLFVFPSTKLSFSGLVSGGFCIGAITDSIFTIDGLVPVNLPTLYQTPYAIAISKSPQINNLKQGVQEVLLEMLTQTNGTQSYMEILEEKYISSIGISKNQQLSELSKSITLNNGNYIGQRQEDDIWQAANLTAVRKISEDLLFIDPTYDQICRDAMEIIYQDFINGKAVADLPMMYENTFVYTFVASTEDPTKMIESWTLLRHPVYETGLSAQEIAIDNPQFLSTIQIIQDVYLSDENNKKQGAFFYVATPFDAKPAIESDNSRSSLISPTRVIKTLLFQTLQEKSENKKLILQVCGAGEKRAW